MVSIHDIENVEVISVAKWRGPLQICQASRLLGVSNSDLMTDSECMHQMRDVPTEHVMASPPYCSLISCILVTMVSMASSQLMRTQPGSTSPLGLVRFMG